MKKILAITMNLMLCIAMLCSCAAKTSAISDLRSFAKEIDKNGATYTVTEWKAAAVEYEKIDNRLKKYDYTTEQQEEIARLKGQCVGSFARNVATNASNKVQGAAAAVKGFIEGIKEAFKDK